MRVVLDTNILVRANAKAKGPARELLLRIVHSPEHVLLLSPFLLSEVERVFGYSRVRAATKLTDEEVANYVTHLHHCKGRIGNHLPGTGAPRRSIGSGR
jgi:predicted nucleic acid-binding protein